MDLAARPALAQHYRLYALDPARALAFVGTKFEQLLRDHPGLYVEIRNNVVLAFRPDQDLAPPEAIESLLALTGPVGGPGGARIA